MRINYFYHCEILDTNNLPSREEKDGDASKNLNTDTTRSKFFELFFFFN